MQQNIITDMAEDLPFKVGSIPASGVSSAPSRIAQELAAWNGKIETDPSMLPRLTAYWSNLNYAPWSTNTAWSAAWVSWVLRGEGFPGASAHRDYTQAIVQGEIPEWKAYSIAKNLDKIRLEPGDVLVRSRGSAPPTDKSGDYYKSHGAIVFRITKTGLAEIVGGNSSDTVRVESRFQVDNKGRPTHGLGDYQIILKRAKKKWLQWMIPLFVLGALWKKSQ